MKLAESVFFNMAMANLNVAVDRVRELLDESKFPQETRDYEWIRLVCAYTRCIHVNVWRDHAPKDRVKSEIIPLFSRAKEEVGFLLKRRTLSEERRREIRNISVNMRVREGNLTQRYLNSLDSCFPVDSIEPRLAGSQ